MEQYRQRAEQLLKTSPIGSEVPDNIWETIHATWTGLWTDAYGEWDEKQASDVFPISDLLSTNRELWLKQQILSLALDLATEIVGEMESEAGEEGFAKWKRIRNTLRTDQLSAIQEMRDQLSKEGKDE